MKFHQALVSGQPIRVHPYAIAGERHGDWLAVGEDGSVVNLRTAKVVTISREALLCNRWEVMDEDFLRAEREHSVWAEAEYAARPEFVQGYPRVDCPTSLRSVAHGDCVFDVTATDVEDPPLHRVACVTHGCIVSRATTRPDVVVQRHRLEHEGRVRRDIERALPPGVSFEQLAFAAHRWARAEEHDLSAAATDRTPPTEASDQGCDLSPTAPPSGTRGR